jgi:hypothetical protein
MNIDREEGGDRGGEEEISRYSGSDNVENKA